MHPRRYLIAALLLVAMGGTLYGTRSSILPWAARWLNVGQRPAKADYVYVLGGDATFRPLVAAAIAGENIKFFASLLVYRPVVSLLAAAAALALLVAAIVAPRWIGRCRLRRRAEAFREMSRSGP